MATRCYEGRNEIGLAGSRSHPRSFPGVSFLSTPAVKMLLGTSFAEQCLGVPGRWSWNGNPTSFKGYLQRETSPFYITSQFCSFPSAPMLACGVPRESPEAPWRRRDLVRSRGEMCAVSCTVSLAERPVAFFIYLH